MDQSALLQLKACKLEKKGNVFVLTLTGDGDHRFNPSSIEDITQALDFVHKAPGPKALVTTNEGRYFSNGLDLKWIGQNMPSSLKTIQPKFEGLLCKMMKLGLPTIAAINGHAAAGGFMFALVHDYRFMKNDKSVLYMSELDHGMSLPRSLMSVIKEKVPPSCLREVVLRSQKFTASEARTLGLIDGFSGSLEITLEQAMGEANKLATKKWDMEVYASLRCALYPSMIEELEAHRDPYIWPKGMAKVTCTQAGAERKNTQWYLSRDNYFIELMLKQVNQGRLISSGFHRDGWNEMAKMMKKKFGKTFDKDKLKNRFKTLKKIYREVKQLLGQSGFRWCDKKKMVTAELAVWEEFIVEHPWASKYRVRILPNIDTLAIAFGETIEDWRQSQRVCDTNLDDIMPLGDTDQNDLSGHMSAAQSDAPHIDPVDELAESSSSGENAKTSSSQSKRRQSEAPPFLPPLKKRVICEGTSEVMEPLVKTEKILTSPQNLQKQCLESVKEIYKDDELDKDLFLKASDLFRDPLNSNVFLALNPKYRKRWLDYKVGRSP
ncbi:hypothetical protein AMTRI_Chr01g127030 [Amborella trichopoda]